ncbi:S-(hydroxymethyl)glutathione synthase [Xanthomonas theicola]|uniref:Glutathione-dependent formaldehyde-activating enzyme n=1 Tax=Xanthomonas theicola TaxID=56464 RepID=A0A2S6ZJR9_9XANT|nr:S-(hydroxymethyl)glutathione synthase [Xanthomonas theicola]PPT92498.1 S-(hydroxymethyl)glutathione synthase [Xanthomonas theicola]QNH26414.1 S-(hydroxymethyl)glutathione synthase [Xanthomonas theicola]
MSTVTIHPPVDGGVRAGAEHFQGSALECHCASDKVAVDGAAQRAHNRACGCTMCWKPEEAAFSAVAVVGRDRVKVAAHEEKLEVVDERAPIRRHACTGCGVHMYGRIENTEHAFYGLDFIDTELSLQQGCSALEFAAFVSWIIENGTRPEAMDGIRSRLRELKRKPCDCLSPPSMDPLSPHIARNNGVLH